MPYDDNDYWIYECDHCDGTGYLSLWPHVECPYCDSYEP